MVLGGCGSQFETDIHEGYEGFLGIFVWSVCFVWTNLIRKSVVLNMFFYFIPICGEMTK